MNAKQWSKLELERTRIADIPVEVRALDFITNDSFTPEQIVLGLHGEEVVCQVSHAITKQLIEVDVEDTGEVTASWKVDVQDGAEERLAYVRDVMDAQLALSRTKKPFASNCRTRPYASSSVTGNVRNLRPVRA